VERGPPYPRRTRRRAPGAVYGRALYMAGRCIWPGAVYGRALYMATLAAIQHNQKIRTFYQRLVDRGKEAKVALIAAARKLLVILNTMLKNQMPWQPNHSPATA